MGRLTKEAMCWWRNGLKDYDLRKSSRYCKEAAVTIARKGRPVRGYLARLDRLYRPRGQTLLVRTFFIKQAICGDLPGRLRWHKRTGSSIMDICHE